MGASQTYVGAHWRPPISRLAGPFFAPGFSLRVTAVDIPERYVWLCLRVRRHIDGFIDAYIGPSEWEQSVAADEPVDPRHLRDEVQLLVDGLGYADLEDDRRRWLRGQLEALECVTAILRNARPETSLGS